MGTDASRSIQGASTDEELAMARYSSLCCALLCCAKDDCRWLPSPRPGKGDADPPHSAVHSTRKEPQATGSATTKKVQLAGTVTNNVAHRARRFLCCIADWLSKPESNAC